MEALLANMPLTPEQRAQILAARQQDLEAAREEERQAGALQDQRVRNLQNAPEVTALLKHSVANKSTNHRLRNDLNAAIYVIDEMDDPSQLVSDFREKLSDQLSIIGSGTGTASNKRKREVQHALEVFGVQVSPGGGGFDGGVVVAGELSDDDDDDDDDEAEEAAAAADGGVVVAPTEREQEPPAADAPLVVRQAFDLIMSSPTMRRSLRFTLAPFLLQIHRNVLAAQATAGTKNDGLLTMEETIKMFGGGRTQARKTPLKASAFVLCRMMGVPTLLLTTNVAGREDLFKKFSELLAEIDVVPARTSGSSSTRRGSMRSPGARCSRRCPSQPQTARATTSTYRWRWRLCRGASGARRVASSSSRRRKSRRGRTTKSFVRRAARPVRLAPRRSTRRRRWSRWRRAAAVRAAVARSRRRRRLRSARRSSRWARTATSAPETASPPSAPQAPQTSSSTASRTSRRAAPPRGSGRSPLTTTPTSQT